MKLSHAGKAAYVSAGCWLLIVVVCALLAGCQFGQTVMVSKGEAGGLVEMWGGQVDYCKITTTEGVELSEATQVKFAEYCLSQE